jgi:uncharacterized YokU family protein
MKCEWCESAKVVEDVNVVYWELPNGTRAIEIHATPCINCTDCGMTYQTEETVKEIENQLFLIRTTDLPKLLTYKELMGKPRLLKRNYFDFSTKE